MDRQIDNISEESKVESAWQKLERGEAPADAYELGELSVGVDFLTDFIKSRYFEEFIADGGSKLKFITGRRGSGKTHLINSLLLLAKEGSYITVSLSAEEVWLHDFKELYLEIMRQCDIEKLVADCAASIIKNMGHDPIDIGEGKTFADYLSEIGEADPVNKRELRNLIRKTFLDNPRMDNNFAQCMALLAGGILGHPVLEASNRELLLRWLHCDTSVKLLQIRSLGLSPSRINRFNARHMLRSLAEVVRLGGHGGLVIAIDNMEVLLNRSSLLPIHYSKMRREDAYESIRQLIDEIDNMRYLMFLFGFDRSLMDNINFGLKSYQALWMRIQNEVVGERFNCFADIIDLDRLGAEIYTDEKLVEMSGKLHLLAQENGCLSRQLTREDACELVEKARFGSIGLPLAVNRKTLGLEKEEEHVR